MAINDVYRLTRSVNIDGVLWQNVFHFEDTVGTEEGAAEALVAQWQQDNITTDSVEDEIRAWTDGYSTVTQLPYVVQKIAPETMDAESIEPDAWTPGAGSQPLPTFCAGLVQVKTGFADRSKRGRFYLAGIAEGYTTGNILTGQGVTNIQAVINSMEKYMMDGGSDVGRFRFGVWSRKNQDFTRATKLSYSSRIAVMRSRKLGYGA